MEENAECDFELRELISSSSLVINQGLMKEMDKENGRKKQRAQRLSGLSAEMGDVFLVLLMNYDTYYK